MSKFKVGDKVRTTIKTAGLVQWQTGVVKEADRDSRFPYSVLFEGQSVPIAVYASEIELVERALEDWEQKLLNAGGGTPEFKPGDRVAVAFEGVITDVFGNNAYFDVGVDTLAAPLSSLSKLTEPIPTGDGAVIRLQNSVYELEDNGYWESIGSVANYSHKEIQGWADTYGFTVLYAGDE